MVKWKDFANWMKLAIVLEMLALFVFTEKGAWDVVTICLAQYAIFLPVDASMVIRTLKGVK